jgi:peptide-methionine (R)-S-oxide reductase
MSLIQIYSAVDDRIVERELIERNDVEWRELLPPEVFFVARKKGTEPPFTGRYHNCHKPGIYTCACCGIDLFFSTDKFDSGTGWPSFRRPVSDLNLMIQQDRSGGMIRDEVLCALCSAHLGHVFDDGPPPDGRRFCMNSLALMLVKDLPNLSTRTE